MTESSRTAKAEDTGENRHSVFLEARKKLRVEGVAEVESFDDVCILLRTSCGELTIDGSEMKISSLDTQTGSVCVSGNVSGIQYSDSRPRRRKRLFGADE